MQQELRPRTDRLRRKSSTKVKRVDPLQVVELTRVSTDRQQNSVEIQNDQLHAFAKSRGLTIMASFADENVSAVSTSFMERPGVKKMLRYMVKNNIRTILMQRPDRSFRKVYDFAISMMQLDKMGIYFRFIEPDIDLSTPVGKLIFQLLVQFAEMESSIRQQRQLATTDLFRKKRIARNGRAPYGWDMYEHPTEKYKNGNPKKILKPNLDQQAILQTIVSMRDEHECSFNEIMDKLNKDQTPSPMAGKTIRRNGKEIECDKHWKIRSVMSVYAHADLATMEEIAAAA